MGFDAAWPPLVRCKDLGSSGGTFVDDARAPPNKALELKEGAVLRIGDSPTTYRVLGIKAEAPTRWALPKWATPPSLPCELVEDEGGTRTPLDDACTVIGRHGQLADLVVADDSVSRQHAVIVHRDDESFIMDMGSTHGTYVDSEASQPNQFVPMEDGSKLRIGKASSTFTFRLRRTPKKRAREPELEVDTAHREQPVDPESTTYVAYNPLAAIFGNANRSANAGFSWNDVLK